MLDAGTKLPAHRPSRRAEIVDAAVRVFARKGFAETSVQDVADEAGVVPTTVYYHFAGKDELFDVALGAALAELDAATDSARPAEDPQGPAALATIIGAVWEWIESRPDQARMVYSHLSGVTQQAQQLRSDFEERHIERAYVYAQQAPEDQRRHHDEAAAQAAARLSIRTLIHLLISIHALRLDGGPLSKRSPRALRAALIDVSLRITARG